METNKTIKCIYVQGAFFHTTAKIESICKGLFEILGAQCKANKILLLLSITNIYFLFLDIFNEWSVCVSKYIFCLFMWMLACAVIEKHNQKKI